VAFTVPNYDKYYQEAYDQKLQAYYAKLLNDEGGDVERAKSRLLQDYQRGIRINTEDYSRNIDFGRESAAAAKTEQGLDSAAEQRKLEADMVRRGISQGGVADQEQGRLKTRQDLRREAIDRALRKSEQDLQYGKERGIEEETIKQRRGTEDLDTNWNKFQTEKGQERQDKAAQLADSSYNREFSKNSTQESFNLQNQGLDLQRQSLAKMG
jgi:hypothetical protein